MMTERARHISAFVSSLGHFEWLRMSLGLKNAPMTYQRLIDNALWGYVQPKGGWSKFLVKVVNVDREAANRQTKIPSGAPPRVRPTHTVTKFESDCYINTDPDAVQRMVNDPENDMFLTGEPDESKLVPVQASIVRR